MKLQKLLLASIAKAYPSDNVRPGLVLSDLGDGDTYASVCRYPNGPHAEKRVVVKARGRDLAQAIRLLTVVWLIERRAFDAFTKELEKSLDEELAS
jgi:hypothetical protein